MDEQLVKLNQKIARIKDISDPEHDRLVAKRNKIVARNERQSTASSGTSRATEVKSDPEKIEQLTKKISTIQAEIDRIKDMSDPRYEQYEAEKAQLKSERLKSGWGSKSTKRTDVPAQVKEPAPIVQADLKKAQKMIHHELDDQLEKLSVFFDQYKFKYNSSMDEKNIKELGDKITMHKKRYDLKMGSSFRSASFYGMFKQHEKQSELALGNFIEKWKKDQAYYRDTHSVIEKIYELKETITKNHNLEKCSMKFNIKQNELIELKSKKQQINFFSKYILNRQKYRQLKNQINKLKSDLNIVQKARLLAMKGDYEKSESLLNVCDRIETSHEVKQRRLTQKSLTPSLATSMPNPSKLQNKMAASISKSAEIMQRKSVDKLRNSSHKEQRA